MVGRRTFLEWERKRCKGSNSKFIEKIRRVKKKSKVMNDKENKSQRMGRENGWKQVAATA